jgi:hypothetical protein
VEDFQTDATIHLSNEASLQAEVVKYLRRVKAVFNGNGISVDGDTEERRRFRHTHGYQRGVPGLFVFAKRTDGAMLLAIELKTPNGLGVLAPVQRQFMTSLTKCGVRTLVSNNLLNIVTTIDRFISNLCP